MQWLAEGVSGGSNSDCTANVSAAEKVIFSYDNFTDLQSVDYPGTDADVQYMRDNEGNLTKLTAGSTQQVYEYNSLNLLENEQLTVDGHSYTVDYHYDALGRLTGLSYPDATKVNYHLNGFGEPVQATSTAQTYALNATYHPGGLLKKFNYGNGIEHIKNLNARRFPASIIEKHKTTTLLHYDYEYDAQGNITALHDYVNPAYSINTLTYDGLDRLVNTAGRSAIGNSAINYDALGNITSYTTKNSSLNYTYNSAINRLTSITGSKNYTFKYADGRGNVTHNGLRSFSFNRANQLIASDKNSYFYDGNNHRVKVVDSQGETYSLYSKSGRLLYREVNGHGINYIYLGKKLIAKQSSATTGVSGYRHYKPFGETLKPSVDGIAYSGHEFDSELGLTYMKARYYDQSIGRFMSVDPVGFNAENPHSFNRYAYANNNPYKFTDPDGRVPVFLLVFVAKEVAGAVFEHYTGLPAPTVKGLAKGTIKAASKLGGRSGKQARLREMMNDPRVSSADRGWLKNDARHIEYGNKSGLRLPRNGRKSPGRKAADKGYELAHPHNKPASQGNGYAGSKLKNHADHKVETRLHRHRY